MPKVLILYNGIVKQVWNKIYCTNKDKSIALNLFAFSDDNSMVTAIMLDITLS